MKFPKGTTQEFRSWYARYLKSLERGFSKERQLPTSYAHAEDFVAQYDRLNRYTGQSYTWNPSPVSSATAPAIRELLQTVTVEECHEPED